MTDDFKALIDSLGHMTLDHLKGFGVREVRIFADEDFYTAHLVACVAGELGDEQRERLVGRLIDARTHYLDELTISLGVEEGCAADASTSDVEAEAVGRLEFAYAG